MFYEAGGAEELQFRAPIHAGASCFIRVEGLKLQFRAPIHAGASCFIRVEGLKNCRGSGLRVVCLSFGL